MNGETYRVVLAPLDEADGGGFVAIAPELPGCRSDGQTPHEALASIYDVIDCWIEGAREMGRAIPESPRAAV